MINATLVKTFRSTEKAGTYRFTAPTVLAGATSDEIKLRVPRANILSGVKMACASVDFDASFRQKAGITAPNIDEIFAVEDVNRAFQITDPDIRIPYCNQDSPLDDALYLVIVNTDAVNATGTVTIDITIEDLERAV